MIQLVQQLNDLIQWLVLELLFDIGLKWWKWVQSENMMKGGLQIWWFELGGSSMKYYKMWSTEVLRVGAFSVGVEDPFKW